jgi:hypothetical protein
LALLSVREFAKRDGCSHTAVQNAISEGRLIAEAGKLDEGLVDSGWRRTNRRPPPASGKLPPVELRAGETPEQAAARIVTLGAELLNIADAERLKENYLGWLRQLEYDQKAGAVVPAEEVAEMQDALMEVVVEALEELTRDAGDAAG